MVLERVTPRRRVVFQGGDHGLILGSPARGILVRLRERETCARSNAFYSAAIEQLVAEESGAGYGIASRPPRP